MPRGATECCRPSIKFLPENRRSDAQPCWARIACHNAVALTTVSAALVLPYS